MQMITTIGLDVAKSVFQVHGVDAADEVVSGPGEAHRSVGSVHVEKPPGGPPPRPEWIGRAVAGASNLAHIRGSPWLCRGLKGFSGRRNALGNSNQTTKCPLRA